jgi:hypothetical protein
MRRAPFAPVERRAVETFGPGQGAEVWTAGDILLTHGDATISRLIRFGERLRIHGDDRAYCWFNHAALVVNDDGDLAEALSKGVLPTNASKYLPRSYTVVRPDITAADAEELVAFANWVLDHHDSYGWPTIASIALSVLTGSKFTFFVEGTFICSGFVARAMERTGAIFNLDPVHITPADLAKYYNALPPADTTASPA